MTKRLIRVLVTTGTLLWLGLVAAQAATYSEQSSSGYYQPPPPGAYQLYLQSDTARGAYLGAGPGGDIRKESFKADAHDVTRGYRPGRDCLDCHEQAARNIHSVRANIGCHQCHRDQPISGVHHYYSPLNPIRRHAYVCAKCHQGASANFATYVVHEPNPLATETAERFPALYYGVWVMVILAGGVFLFFIPYIGAWGVRELIALKGGHTHGG